MKTCKRCKVTKELSEYTTYKRAADGLNYWCRTCHNEVTNTRRSMDKPSFNNNEKTYKLKANYNLSREDYQNLLTSQDYKCAICETEIVAFTKQTHVDHNHDTGRVRGLLCNRCNMGLGLFKDSWQLLSGALNYLERNDG